MVFDTTVLIAYLRGRAEALEILRSALGKSLAVGSVISRVEIEGGMRTHERPDVSRLFSVLPLEPVSDLIASRAGEFLRKHRRSHSGIEIVDYVIAATADVMGAELLTLNVKHFPMFRGLKPAF